jgi:hypothetical protein
MIPTTGSVATYDIYTADVRLFTEPLTSRLGPVWQGGFTVALALVRAVTDGSAVPWGRSTGLALSVGHAGDHSGI